MREVANAPAEPPTVLVVDQFEEPAAADPHGARELLGPTDGMVVATHDSEGVVVLLGRS